MRRFFSAVLAALLGLTLLAGCSSPENTDDVRVSFIDVGKGDCILVQAGESAMLIDAGYEDTADGVMAYLQQQGIKNLDCLVITHYDKDHAGGAAPIVRAMPVGMVYLPGYAGSSRHYTALMEAIEQGGLASQQVTEDVEFSLCDAQVQIIASDVEYDPYGNGDEGNDNDASLVAALTLGDDSYLFAGDLEKEGIAAYLESGHGQYDVIKMPHHGAKSGNTDDLLDEVRPRIAVITDSANDPAESKALAILEELGARVYRTSTDGTIVVESSGTGSYSVSTARS